MCAFVKSQQMYILRLVLFLNVNFTSKERKLNTGLSLVHDMHAQVLGRRKVFEMPHKLGELMVEKHMTK